MFQDRGYIYPCYISWKTLIVAQRRELKATFFLVIQFKDNNPGYKQSVGHFQYLCYGLSTETSYELVTSSGRCFSFYPNKNQLLSAAQSRF